MVLQGETKREGHDIVDPNCHEPVWIPEGFYFVDDGVRYIRFSPAQVQEVKGQPSVPADLVLSGKYIDSLGLSKSMPPVRSIVKTGDWDAKWNRDVTIKGPNGNVAMRQNLGLLTPHTARIDSFTKYTWSSFYFTKELGPSMVQSLLAKHKDFEDKPG